LIKEKSEVKTYDKQVNKNIEKKSDIIIRKKPEPLQEKKWDLATAMKNIIEEEYTISMNQDSINIEEEESITDNENNIVDKEAENKAIISLENAVRQQLSVCWSNNSGKLKEVGKNEYVIAKARYTKEGQVIDKSVLIDDTNIAHKLILINAVKFALYSCRFDLPKKFFYLWEDMTVRFDYNAMNEEIINTREKRLNLFN